MPASSIRNSRLAFAPGLMLLAGVVGAGAGLGAAVLILSIDLVAAGAHRLALLPGLGRAWMFLTVPAGIWLAWRLTAWFAPEVAGHGVPQIIAALTVRGGHIRPRVAPLKIVATALTIGGGGSAGREGSIAQIGATLGSVAGLAARLGEPEVRALVAAGAGAGIAATFNAPIAGMFFAMEVVLQDLSIRHLHTVIVAAVVGAVVSHSLIGEALTFQVPTYSLDDPWQLLLYGVLGLVVVGLAIFYIEGLDWWSERVGRVASWVRPLLLGLGIAAIGFLLPEVLGTGQVAVDAILSQRIDAAWWILGLAAVGKAVTTPMTLGARGAGGIFMPSLFIGAAAGSAFAQVATPFWPVSTLNPGAFAVVGMAAMFAAVARAPLTSILIVFEITGDYGLVLPLMAAVAVATFLANQLHPESAYTSPLLRMGIHGVRMDHIDLLDTVAVGDLGLRPPVVVSPDATLGEAEGILRRHRLHGAPVIENGRLIGLIAESDILRAGGPSDQVTVREAMTPDPVSVTTEMPVSAVLERMAALGIGRLPVVDPEDPGRLLAMFRREDAIAAYHLALGRAARRDRLPERVRRRRTPGTGFFEFTIPPDSVADGRKIKEVPWPEGCIVVSIHRGHDLLVASGDVELRAGDAVTAFGDEPARRRLLERLGAGAAPA